MALGTKIVALRHLDIVRDGGSVVATFEGADGIEYPLFFGIAQRATERTLRRYRLPLLEWRPTAVYRSPSRETLRRSS